MHKLIVYCLFLVITLAFVSAQDRVKSVYVVKVKPEKKVYYRPVTTERTYPYPYPYSYQPIDREPNPVFTVTRRPPTPRYDETIILPNPSGYIGSSYGKR